jgi:PTH1 family peptidyl-tRNA hydrolase
MKYIVALGNPGEKYKNTRHNVGFMAVDKFIEEFRLPGLVESKSYSGLITEGVFGENEIKILYPDTYMNNSGSAVAKLVSKNETQHLVVVHDDIDLPFGEIKIGKNQGAGGNNGVKSIIEKLGSKEFSRVRIGIAPKSFWTGKTNRPKGGGPLERFVLKPFGITEKKELSEVLSKASSAIKIILEEGVDSAMNRLN